MRTCSAAPRCPRLPAQEAAAETLQQHIGLREKTDPPPPEEVSSPDLGDVDIVQKYPKPATLTFSTSQDFFYTDNVFYTDANPVGSTAYLASYTASYVPYSLRDWTPRITAQYDMLRYGNVPAGDFDNENLALSSQYIFSDDRAWSWLASINLSRFTSSHNNDHQFYSEVVYDNQVSNSQQLLKGTPLFLVTTYELAYPQANPSIYDRLDNTLSVNLAYYITPQLSVGPYVRPSSRTYLTNGPATNGVSQHGREDFNLSEGVDLTWKPWKYTSFSTDFLHTNDYSNNSGQSYDNTVPGVSVTGTVEF